MWILSTSLPQVCQTCSAPVIPPLPYLRLLPFAHPRPPTAAQVCTTPTWYTQIICTIRLCVCLSVSVFVTLVCSYLLQKQVSQSRIRGLLLEGSQLFRQSLWWQQARHYFQLLLEDPEVFLGQIRCLIPPVCSGLALGSTPI